MNKTLKIALAVCALVLSSLACSLVSGGSSSTSQNNNILFQDDFSDTNGGWQTMRENDSVADYENGGFRFYVPETNMDYWSYAGINLTDVHIEVDATKVGGPDDNDFGIICRYQEDGSFYGFLISSDGYFGISKMKGNEHNVLNADGMEYSDKILTGAATNHIGADCIGSTLKLYVNGEKIAEYEDTDFTSGDVGLLAGTFDTTGVDILFDNLVVTKP